MAKDRLDTALAYTFKNEGSYSDNPHDRGGATSGFGITISELARWRKHPVSKLDVKNMTAQEAKDIYEAWYWRPLACDRIQDVGVAVAMFDLGVVRGIGVPPKYAQRVCNQHGAGLVPDGHLGPLSLAAINALEPSVFIRDFSAMAEAGFRSIVAGNPSQGVFLKGWVNRARRLLTLIGLKAA